MHPYFQIFLSTIPTVGFIIGFTAFSEWFVAPAWLQSVLQSCGPNQLLDDLKHIEKEREPPEKEDSFAKTSKITLLHVHADHSTG